MFGNFNLINAINEKIDIENIINKIEEIIEKIKRKSDNILNNIIPSIKNTISKYTKNGILDELMIKVENMTKIINSLSEKIMPIFKFIRENMNKLKEINLNEIVLDKINILFTKIDEIMKKADSLKNNYVDINENNTKEILKKTDILIDLIYNLEEWINEKIKNMLNKILTPIDKMIEYLMNLSNKIKDKIYEIKIELIQKLDISVENLKNSVYNLIDKLLDKGLDLLPNTSFDIGIPTLKEKMALKH